MDVSDIGKDVLSMGRLLRSGYDMHFAGRGHRCWVEKDGDIVELVEDNLAAEAPLTTRRSAPDHPERRLCG